MVTDYDPITDDFDLHEHIDHPEQDLEDDPNADLESFLVPPIDGATTGNGNSRSGSPRKSYAKAEKKHHHKMRPKSAPKHRQPRHPSPGEGYSNEEYYEESEEDLRVPIDDDEGSSACISDQDYHQPPPKSSDKIPSPKGSSAGPSPDQRGESQHSPKAKSVTPSSPGGPGVNGTGPSPTSKPQAVSPSDEQVEKVN